MIPSFQEFLYESEKFETMYDIEAYTQNQSSPSTYEKTLAFYNKLPKLPNILEGFKAEKGTFERLLLVNSDTRYRVDFDFTRKVMNVYNTDNDTSEDVIYKMYPFTELINA